MLTKPTSSTEVLYLVIVTVSSLGEITENSPLFGFSRPTVVSSDISACHPTPSLYLFWYRIVTVCLPRCWV